MKCLVGRTGFVGSNLWASGAFDAGYHSSDVQEAYGLRPELLVYAGVRAEKYLANQDEEADWAHVSTAIDNIRAIAPKKLVLISTVDVYPMPAGVDEASPIAVDDLQPYGRNRYRLEEVVREEYPGALIVRLPALYGKNLKKNFIYDMMTLIPQMLRDEKYHELASQSPLVKQSYAERPDGFYICKARREERPSLKAEFQRMGFTSLLFTDSRSIYQFYPLRSLWKHIEIAEREGITLLNLATEPIQAGELYRFLHGEDFMNEMGKNFPRYDFRTKYAELFGGHAGYIYSKVMLLEDIRTFVEEQAR